MAAIRMLVPPRSTPMANDFITAQTGFQPLSRSLRFAAACIEIAVVDFPDPD
jgi:hypothetical protein